MRRVVLLLVLLLLTAPAHAWDLEAQATVQVLFQTSPSGATVELLGMQAKTIGQTGIPMALSIPKERDTTLHVRLTLDGYRPYDMDVSTATLRGPGLVKIPPDRVIGLVPTSPMAVLRVYAGRYWGVALLVMLGGLGLLAVILPRQRRLLARFKSLKRLAVPRRADDPNVGRLIDGWLLTKQLGVGGYAAVYEAVPWETLDDRQAVAVKVVHPDLATDEFRRRFSREVNIGRSLQHPNLVRVLNWHDGDVLCIFMELVRGRSLRDFIPAKGLPPKKAMELLKPIAQGVAYAHSKSIVHNDLKPGNVLVTPQGEVRVMDFGIATGKPFTRLTATGEAMGTPGYMAPEQFDGIRNDPRSDQYALGIMAFEMLTGDRPFDDEDPMRCMAMHMTEAPPRVSSIRPDVPEKVSDVIDRMLAKEPKDRYPSVQAALEALLAASA